MKANPAVVGVLLLLASTVACKEEPRKFPVGDPDPPATATPTALETATATATAAPTSTSTAKRPAATTAAKTQPPKAGGGGAAAAADAPCPGPGLTRRCGGRCVNLQTDDRNCGTCGTVCASGKHCDGHLFCRDASGNL